MITMVPVESKLHDQLCEQQHFALSAAMQNRFHSSPDYYAKNNHDNVRQCTKMSESVERKQRNRPYELSMNICSTK
jgi:hypothetical protein